MNFRKLGAVAAATLTFGAGGTVAADRKINPYNDKGTHYELALKSDIPQGERVEIAKDRATMTLKGWNDEYAITIEPQIPSLTFGAAEKIDRPFTVAANRPLLSKKMEYQSGDVTAFIEPKEGTENEFDIDFTLHSKPDTNVFTYKIEGAEEFGFFYQPELTPEELAEGAERPENVIGSYAVYHKTKANHRVGSTNYATGKAFHIYRPKAIDADGAEVWAELSYVDGILSVTVPQKFLDGAVYPVRVDPTFGKNSTGASTAANGGARANVHSTSIYTAAAGDTIVSYSSNCYHTGSGGTRGLAAYSISSGQASTRLGSVQDITCAISPGGWATTTTFSEAMSAGTTYGIAVGATAAGGGDNTTIFRYDTLTGNAFDRQGTTYTLGASWSHVDFSAAQLSIYATYTASGGGSGGSSSTPQVIIFE